MAASSSEHLRVDTAGGLEIWVGDRCVTAEIPEKAALLVAYLADAGSPVTRSKLAGLLWSDTTDDRARASLRIALTRTRESLGEILHADRTSLALTGPVELDSSRIENGSPIEALDAYRGEYLAGVDVAGAPLFDEWLRLRRQTLDTTAMRKLRAGAEAAADGGRWNDLLAFSSRMLDIEPWNEAAHRHKIQALLNTDGRAAALAAFQACVDRLDEDLGIEPDSETTELARTIRESGVVAGRSAPNPSSQNSTITWRLLGDVAVVIDDVVQDLGGAHRRSVIAALAREAPRACALDDLATSVWGEQPPKTARQSIRRFIRELRTQIAPFGDRIEAVPGGYRLAALPTEVDLTVASDLIAEARAAMDRGEHAEASRGFLEALSLWDGRSLGGVTTSGRARSIAVSVEELRLGAFEDLIEAELAMGRHRQISSQAEAFAADHPSRERAWTNLMLVRYRCGRQAAALDAYEVLRTHLAEIEGIEPSPFVRSVHRQISDQLPVADAPGPGGTASGGPAVSGVEQLTQLSTTSFDSPLPPALEQLDAPLVGRENELATVVDLITTAETGRPGSAFVAGEPGIGKTRLAAELARSADQAGFSVLYGRSEEGLSVPYQAWREALAHLAEHVPPHLVRRHLDRFGESLRLLMPSLAGVAGQSAPAGELTDTTQQLLFEATAAMLRDLAGRRPLLLILDDLQWAEPSTLGLLRHIARTVDAPIAVLGLYRSTEVGADHELSNVIASLDAAGRASELLLGGLAGQAQIDLALRIVGSDRRELANRIASDVGSATNGNPFFFIEMLQSMVETDEVAATAAGADMPSLAASIPPTVQRVVLRRVARLGDEAADLLRSAAVFGREFDLETLAVARSLDDGAVLDHLETALAAGLLTDAPQGRDRFAFSHDLVHHTLVDELSTSRRCRLHGAIADAIEQVHGPDLGDLVGEVATHLVAADDPKNLERASRLCRQAGRHAASRHAPAEAARWFQQSLDLLDDLEREGSADPLQRGALLVELGTQQRDASNPDHRTTLIDAGRLALGLGDVDTLVASALANSRGMNSHVWEIDEPRIEILHAALDAVGTSASAARADLLASLANEQWDEAHRLEAEQLYTEALSLARRIGDVDTLARVLIRASRARNYRLPRAQLAEAADELRDLAAGGTITDPLLLANALTTVLNTAIRLGRPAEAYAAIDELNAAAAALPLPALTLAAHLGRGLAAGQRGDIAAYEAEAVNTFNHATEIEDAEAGFIFEGQMFHLAYVRGDLMPLLDFSVQIMNERPDVPLYRAASTLIHVGSGEYDGARRLIDSELETGIEPSVDMFQVQALATWANAAASLEHVAGCRRLYEVLEHMTTETTGHLVQVGEPIDISLGRMATVLGRYEDAEHHFQVAREIADGFGSRWGQAQIEVSRAQMLLLRADPGDTESAMVAATEAGQIADAEGYGGIAAAARDILGEPAIS